MADLANIFMDIMITELTDMDLIGKVVLKYKMVMSLFIDPHILLLIVADMSNYIVL